MEQKKRKLGIYVHIPFCIRKCRYCDFLSISTTTQEKRAYIGKLIREIREYPPLEDMQVTSIFFGGGTPSVLPAGWIGEIIDAIREKFEVLEEAEISIEANPGTVDLEKLKYYRDCGINRLSFGLQSAKDEELRRLGRIHTFEDFKNSYRDAREAGFQNINIDLMSGLPGQHLRDWEETLKTAVLFSPEHISAYSLILEEGTELYEVYSGNTEESRRYPIPEEEEEREMYHRTKEILKTNGYERYEISNYAQKGRECRHNYAYWIRQDYLGFGVGAASLLGNKRIQNVCDIRKYITEDVVKLQEVSILERKDEMAEFMFLGLRTMKGVNRREFQKLFGTTLEDEYEDVLKKYKKMGLLKEEEGWIFLTEQGIDVSNVVMADFL